ncbi:phosphatase [Mangrovibacterium marinum]|uniref:Exopolyphosphatase/guanosine-5'-triphosphate, 3'-diphosphate pyrophosphatase n=1 Tax=Mangrovibacterium marinum TaxID=1639118 RepID=A0A2T5C5V6_9BACT|nr:phosphatase [Mangrovibacterium marinum]PTN10289.1 exopolyphosphatase/guanosine-5'-triphosphate,3'-diphosphate pyrophosphatase [Mangrovibacterium marinum]
MKLAIIDLGTNTCNLLIAGINQHSYQFHYQGKVGVKLGKGGIHKNLLSPEAFDRAVAAFNQHNHTIDQFGGVDRLIAIATSAVRDASNKDEFTRTLLEKTGIPLTIVSGDEEARLICQGVKLAFGDLPDNSLILDIGGGSNEFIQTQNDRVSWKESFPLGMARVVEKFPISNPIRPSEAEAIEQWFSSGLSALWQQCREKPPTSLIGCSGAFDTLADLIDNTAPGTKSRVRQEISISQFNEVTDTIIGSTTEYRSQLAAMEPLRIEMIVPAFILIKLVLKKLKIKKMIQTDFALREGVLLEWINH